MPSATEGVLGVLFIYHSKNEGCDDACDKIQEYLREKRFSHNKVVKPIFVHIDRLKRYDLSSKDNRTFMRENSCAKRKMVVLYIPQRSVDYMKKILKVFVSIMLIGCVVTTLVSCEKAEIDTSSDTQSKPTESVDSDTSSIDDTSSTIESEPEVSAPTEEDTDAQEETQSLAMATPNVVLLDANGVKATALDFGEQTDKNYVTFDVHIENHNTHDVHIMMNYFTLNGYLVSASLDSLITRAGVDEIVPFKISKESMEYSGIDEVRELVVSFYVKDADFKLFVSPTERVTLKTNKYDTPAPALNTQGVLAYNEKNILIVVKEELDFTNRRVYPKLLIKNDTNTGISVSCDKLLINGKEIANHNCISTSRVPAGVICFTNMFIEKSDLEALGIQEVKTIEMTLKVLEDVNYTLIAENLTVTVNY